MMSSSPMVGMSACGGVGGGERVGRRKLFHATSRNGCVPQEPDRGASRGAGLWPGPQDPCQPGQDSVPPVLRKKMLAAASRPQSHAPAPVTRGDLTPPQCSHRPSRSPRPTFRRLQARKPAEKQTLGTGPCPRAAAWHPPRRAAAQSFAGDCRVEIVFRPCRIRLLFAAPSRRTQPPFQLGPSIPKTSFWPPIRAPCCSAAARPSAQSPCIPICQ